MILKMPEFWNPDKGSWFFGYWSSGPESLPNDGLLTYHNLEGCSEVVRERDLVEESNSPIQAFLKFLRERVKKHYG